jgi:ASCH domain
MIERIRAISLRQPYANLVSEGIKTLETRKWSTEHRGDLLVCSALQGEGDPKGVALSIVNVVDIRMMTENDAEAACIDLYPRARAWELNNVRKLVEPFAVKGKLGIFWVEVDSDMLKVEE